MCTCMFVFECVLCLYIVDAFVYLSCVYLCACVCVRTCMYIMCACMDVFVCI